MHTNLAIELLDANLTHGPCATGPTPRYIVIVPLVVFLIAFPILAYRLQLRSASNHQAKLGLSPARVAISLLAAFGCSFVLLIVLFFDCINAPGGIGSPFLNSRYLASPLVSSDASATLTGHQDNVRSVAFSHDGEILATATGDDVIRLWNLQDVLSGVSE